MRKYAKALAGGALVVSLLVPAGAALAADDDVTPVCTGDQRREQVHDRLQDGSQDGLMLQHRYGAEATAPGAGGHRSGPQDGTGPQADRPLDGTGNQFGAGR